MSFEVQASTARRRLRQEERRAAFPATFEATNSLTSCGSRMRRGGVSVPRKLGLHSHGLHYRILGIVGYLGSAQLTHEVRTAREACPRPHPCRPSHCLALLALLAE